MELRAQVSQIGLDFSGAAERKRATRARTRVRRVPNPRRPPRQAPAQADPEPLEPPPEPATRRQKLADFRLPPTRKEAHTGELLGRCIDCKRKLAKTAGKGTKWCPRCAKLHQQSIPVDLGSGERKVKKRTRCPTCGGVKRKTDYQCEKCFLARHTRFAQVEHILQAVRELGNLILEANAQRRDPWELMPILDQWLKDKGWRRNTKAPHWVKRAWYKPVYREAKGDQWANLRSALRKLAPKLGGKYIEQPALADEEDTLLVTVPGYFTITAQVPNVQFGVAKLSVTTRKR